MIEGAGHSVLYIFLLPFLPFESGPHNRSQQLTAIGGVGHKQQNLMGVQEGSMHSSSFHTSKPAHQKLNIFDRAEPNAFL